MPTASGSAGPSPPVNLSQVSDVEGSSVYEDHPDDNVHEMYDSDDYLLPLPAGVYGACRLEHDACVWGGCAPGMRPVTLSRTSSGRCCTHAAAPLHLRTSHRKAEEQWR